MNNSAGLTAAEWLAEVEEQELARVLRDYGQERYAKRIARALVVARADTPIKTTLQLTDIISHAIPVRERHKHPATRSFQAIRIWVNQELEELKVSLAQALEVLAVGGRLVVISFHSLEDRIVKKFIDHHSRGKFTPRHLPIDESALGKRLKKIGRYFPSDEEIQKNPRARSAVLRIAEKIA